MTAEDCLQESLKISYFYNDKYDRMCCFSDDVQVAMQEYAKIKCQELLLLVAEKAMIDTEWEFITSESNALENYSKRMVNYKIDKDSILNAVDLNSFII